MNKIVIKVDTSEIEKATEKVKELNTELKKLKETIEGFKKRIDIRTIQI